MALKTLAALIGIGFAGLALAGGSGATVPGQNGKLALTKEVLHSSSVFSIGFGDLRPARLTPEAHKGYSPAFSPDGRKVAFIGGDDQLMTKSAFGATGAIRQLTEDPLRCCYVGGPVFDPDGKSIVYQYGDSSSGQELLEISTSGGEPRRIGSWPGYNLNAAISPNGRIIALATGPLGETEIHLLNRDGSGERRLEVGIPADRPSFSPDGSRIAFTGREGKVSQIFTSAQDGSRVRPLTSGPGRKTNPVYSPDGTKIAFSTANGSVWVMNVDGSNKKKVATGNGSYSLGDWQRKAPLVLRKAVHAFGPLRIVKPEAEVFGPGRLRLSGKFVKATIRVLKSSGTVTVPLKRSLKKVIARKGVARLTVRARFEPVGGLPGTVKRRFTLRPGS